MVLTGLRAKILNKPINDFTQNLKRWRDGDQRSLESILPNIVERLRIIAGGYLRRENPGHTLQATALVNEAYIKLVNIDVNWQDRAHFFAIAARQMRRILVDHAKSKGRFKRGGNVHHESIGETICSGTGNIDEFVMIENTLSKLENFDSRAARIFELKFYGGLSIEEIVEVESLSRATVDRDLRAAKVWITKELFSSS